MIIDTHYFVVGDVQITTTVTLLVIPGIQAYRFGFGIPGRIKVVLWALVPVSIYITPVRRHLLRGVIPKFQALPFGLAVGTGVGVCVDDCES